MNDYVWGVLLGLFLVLVLAFIGYYVIGKKCGSTKYDERQKAGQGKAYQAGFFTLLISVTLVSILNDCDVLPGSDFVWQIAAVLVGVAVFALTAIHFDAYVGMNDTPKRFIIMGGFFTAAMIFSAVGNLMAGESCNHDIGCINLMVAALWIMIVAALLIHNRKKTEEEE
ncbi:MAG: hypothetical protein MJ118_00880 [Clostridia bacterium]|nr:hypothetical protein [Clostridia bacterium]